MSGPTPELVERGPDRLAIHRFPAPEGDPAAPMVVVWPAMGVPARYYRPLAEALRAEGLAAVVVDLRGTGASTPHPRRGTPHGYADLVADVGAVLDTLATERAGRRTLLLGHSLGGQACLMHLALTRPDTVDGLVLVAVGLPYWRLYRGWFRQWTVLPYTQGIAAVTRLLGFWPGWSFGGRQAPGVIRDWAYTARTGRFPRIGGADTEAAVRELRTPVLAVSVEHDRYTPESTVEQLTTKLAAAPVTHHHYTATEAGAPLDHFRWVRHAGPLAVHVAAFARAR